ncbi:MAG: orotidine 5'-phosphate decarboxylase [Deltaproteobacteria bacterium]|jgi:orotidine-5'-phosphate decarboxylase|nr:orotidine 5'-phosphate decarboxylase [Deltaproteobacteria bacterium]
MGKIVVDVDGASPIRGYAPRTGAAMSQIIVAVDGVTYPSAKEKGIFTALAKAREKGMIWGVKISDMLYSGDVTKIISSLRDEYKLGVMVDAKLHDIPSTMEYSISRLVNAGANIISIHCSSNFRPKNTDLLKYIAGVTALTSFTDLEIKWIYDKSHEEIVKAFSDIALMNNYAYIEGSVKDLDAIRDNPLKRICMGIRPGWYPDRHDQVRIASLKEAVRVEADFIVIGRPIMKSANINEAIEKIYAEVR